MNVENIFFRMLIPASYSFVCSCNQFAAFCLYGFRLLLDVVGCLSQACCLWLSSGTVFVPVFSVLYLLIKMYLTCFWLINDRALTIF
jgi:hypothetical protein